MTDRRGVWRRTYGRVVAAGMTIALASVPLRAAAADSPAPPSINLKAAIAKAAATERLATTARLQTAQQGTDKAPESKAFFKTPLGLAVIAIVGSGTAYAVYSAQHDRIHSEVRQ